MTDVSDKINSDFSMPDASEIGAALAASRRSKNISLQELSDSLRIPKMYLKSLENSDFTNLPGVAYVPGYIRSYCKLTGIDSSALVASYIASVGNDDGNPIYEVPGQALVPKFSKSSIAMVAVFITIFGYMGWFMFLREEPEQVASNPPILEQPTNEQKSTTTVSSGLINSENDQIDDIVKPNLKAPTSSNIAVTSELQIVRDEEGKSLDDESVIKIEQAQSQDVSQKMDLISDQDAQNAIIKNNEVSQDMTQLSQSESGVAVEQKLETSNPSSAVAKGIELSDTLTIRAIASAWIEMVNSDGDVITSKLLRSGDSIAASLGDKLYLTTGNAGGLMFEMTDVPAFKVGKTGEIIRDLPLRADSIISRKFD